MEQQTLRRVFADGREQTQSQPLVRQTRLEVWHNAAKIATLACTAGNDAELAVGYLKSTGILAGRMIADIAQTAGLVEVCTREAEYETAEPAVQLRDEWVFALCNAFAKDSALHRDTQGAHCCYLSVDGEIVFSAEDMSRRNALDKAIGYAILHDLPRSHCMVYVTGRVPVDMVEKMLCADMPVLVAKGVPTFEAVQLAKKTGVRLICRAWPDSFDDYG